MTEAKIIRFRDGVETLTLYVEKRYDDRWVFGWCPERDRPMVVHPANVIGDKS